MFTEDDFKKNSDDISVHKNPQGEDFKKTLELFGKEVYHLLMLNLCMRILKK